MITLKNYTCAFLEHEGNFLLMKRAPDRDVNPNFGVVLEEKLNQMK